jgi:hypothetical protein
MGIFVANFKQAYLKTMKSEDPKMEDAKVVLNHGDLGEDTYRGISKRYHRLWNGWGTIEAIEKILKEIDGLYSEIDAQESMEEKRKKGIQLDEEINSFKLTLNEQVMSFYNNEFWLKVRGDQIDSQLIAEELFDTAVNIDPADAIRILQKSLNVLNNRGNRWADLAVDGKIGPKTFSTISSVIKLGLEMKLFKTMNIIQGNHYIELAQQSPSQEINFSGWLERVQFTKV